MDHLSHSSVCDVITHPPPKINGALTESSWKTGHRRVITSDCCTCKCLSIALFRYLSWSLLLDRALWTDLQTNYRSVTPRESATIMITVRIKVYFPHLEWEISTIAPFLSNIEDLHNENHGCHKTQVNECCSIRVHYYEQIDFISTILVCKESLNLIIYSKHFSYLTC